MDSYVIEIQTPDGTWNDVTDLVDIEAMSGYSYGIEDNLLQFRTGDMTLHLHNDAQGTAAGLFLGADPSLTYRLRVNRNGLKLFEGIIEVTGQVSVSVNDAALELGAYGYLALLDKVSAETVKRGFVEGAVSGAAADVLLTFETSLPTRFLQAGDVLRISTDTESEEVEVLNGNGGTIIKLKDPLANGWTATTSHVELLTPFYRRRTIAALVQELFATAGVINPTIDMTGTEFAVPVATPVNTDGLDLSKVPTSFGEINGKLRARFDDNTEIEATDAVSGEFTAVGANVGSASQPGIDDWHVYGTTQPATLVTHPPQEVSGTGGKWALGGIDYSLSPPRAWDARIRVVTGSPDTHHYELRRKDWDTGTKTWINGATEIIDTARTSESTPNSCSCDLDPMRLWVYVSFLDLETDTGDLKILKYYDIGTDSVTTLKSGNGADGSLRYSYEARIMLHLSGTTLTGYDGTEIKFSAEVPDGVILRTARFMPDARKWVIIVRHLDRTHLLIADRLFTTQSLIDFSKSASTRIGITFHQDDADNFLNHFGSQITGVVNGQYVVIDTLYAGVVEYADFEGRTIAGALVELAKLVNCVVWVDNDYNGFFISRGSRIFNPDPQPPALDDLILEQDEDLVWDKWFGRVTVTVPDGRTLTVGDAGNASGEVSIDSSLVPNLSVQHALAIAYEAYYARARRSRTVKLDDNETLYFPLQKVTIGTEEWRVYDSDYNWVERDVRLQLVEADAEVGDEAPPNLGPELIRDGMFELWTAADDLTQWYEFYVGLVSKETTDPYEGSFAALLTSDGANVGKIHSRPGYPTSGSGTGKGTAYFQLTTDHTYRLTVIAKRKTGSTNLTWSIALLTNSTDANSAYFAHGTSGVFDVFAVGNMDDQVAAALPEFTLTTSYQVFTRDILISGGGVSGTKWAAVMFHDKLATAGEAVAIGSVSLREVLS